MLTLLALIILILSSSSSFAFKDNPGSAKNCSSGSVKGIFDKTNYNKLKTSFDTNTYQSMNSGASASSIPLKIKMIINDINVNTTGNTNTVTGTNANPAIDINRNFKNLTSSSDITLDFQNTENNTSLYLGNVALSVFDIDKSIDRNKAGWDDLVSITGITRNNINIKGTFQGVSGSSVIELANGLQNSSTDSSFNCTSSLDTNCQGSVLFSEDVRSVTLSYTNTNNVTNPTSQRFQFRVDSYCYTPQYTFSGTVFNDNAGIAENNNIDLNINTKSDISSTFTSNPKYFNGIFDQGESGISATGLTVSLTNCNGINISGTTAQVVGVSPLSQGQYKFTVPGNVISSLTLQKVCLVQNEPSGWEFSVDTTPNSREITLVSNIFDYKTESNGSRNLDFGEVKSNYSALVLIKSQYVHDCNDLRTFIDMPQNPQPDLPTNGFSTEDISGIVPGQCIAYKIEAHNRGHLNLESIQIKDKLQTNPVKSVFHLPFPVSIPSGINNNNILPNSEIISNQFNLQAAPPSGSATKATLYFNTKYGTTVDP